MQAGEETLACVITVDSLSVILKKMNGHDVPRFAYALLQAKEADGVWYFVDGNLNAPNHILYDQQIMQMEKLDELFETTWTHSHSMWFRVVKR